MLLDGDTFLREVGRRIAELRRSRGLTQESAAESLEMSLKVYQRVERGTQNLTLKTLARVAGTLSVDVATMFEAPQELASRSGRPKRQEPSLAANPASGSDGPPFEVVSEDDPRPHVPLVSLRAAAGSGATFSSPEIAAWVAPRGSRRLRRGMFVARVQGRSMEPVIRSGSFCLFVASTGGAPSGTIALVEHRGVDDPETGGSYTVKRVFFDEPGELRLVSQNRAFAPIIVTQAPDEPTVRVIATLLEVLG